MNKSLLFAVIAAAVVPALIGAVYHAWPDSPPAAPAFDWGVRGNGVLNAVERIEEFDPERGAFSYRTGGRARDAGRLTAPPTHVFAEASDGSVSVRFLGFEGYERARADDEALELARIVSSATTRIFPANPIPVEIDLHFMPESARFSFARRVDWSEGRTYVLALFSRDRVYRETPAHELYHVLAGRWSLPSAPEATRRPGAANSYEEATAELYAACGELLTYETLPRGEPSKDRAIVDTADGDQAFEGALAGDELVAALGLMRNGASGAGIKGFGPMFAATVFEHVFAGATAMVLDSPQAAALLALCKEAAPNPFALEPWLANLAAPIARTN